MKTYKQYRPFEFKYSDYFDLKIRADLLEMRELFSTNSTVFKLKSKEGNLSPESFKVSLLTFIINYLNL